jgi:Na+/H+ antiporter NhaC
MDTHIKDLKPVFYFGGPAGVILPFIVFAGGVIFVSFSGAPNERGFWPVLILALMIGLLLARNRRDYCATVIQGMSRPIVMTMITAWMMASIIGVLMSETGFIEALTWTAGRVQAGGGVFVPAAFLICAVVSVSTGSSFGTILICGPLLYPAGGLLGANPALLAGAVIAGATFGDSIAPISDTTIAGALSQKADIGGTVRSRLKYVLPAGAGALLLFTAAAAFQSGIKQSGKNVIAGSPEGLPMILVPVVIIGLLFAGRHLLEGLFAGLAVGVILGLAFGILDPARLFSLDPENFTAQSFLIDGIDRAVGISFFTILLMGLVTALEASGLLHQLVDFASRRSRSVRSAETWIAGAVSGAVLLTCHSIVAILTVSEFTRITGEKMNIHPYRRANLLSLTVSTYPFILPYFIPVILTANTTLSGGDYGLPPVSPFQVGLHNFYSFLVLAAVAIMIIFGYGRREHKNHLHKNK